MRKQTTIYLDEDTLTWFQRRKAIDGKDRRQLIHEAVTIYAALMDRQTLDALFADQSAHVRKVLLGFRDSATEVPLPKTFED